MEGCPVFFRATGALPNAPEPGGSSREFPSARVKDGTVRRLRLRPGDRVPLLGLGL
jgi:hypothetical protein